jgi:serine/threonine-protein kinase
VEQGEVFAGRYRVVRELGRGGMGVVYEALDQNLDRQVALKVIGLSAREDPAAAGRFRREAKALAAVHHPGVVTIHDSGEADGELFLVMRLVHGTDLGKRLGNHRRLSVDRTVELVAGIAEALDALHAAGVVHRDVKPSNVLLEGDAQRPVLCDFGLAKPTHAPDGVTISGYLVGTVPTCRRSS